MRIQHAQELHQAGEQIDVKVSVYFSSEKEDWYITFRDFEIYEFPKAVTLLRQIKETELPESSTHLIY